MNDREPPASSLDRTSGEAQGDDISGLDARVAKGAAWITAGRLLVRSLGLINTIILARLLTPNDFGLVALGLVTLQLLQNVSDIGVSQTVVKFRNATRHHYDTLFTLSLIRGVVISSILLAISGAAAGFYDDPRAKWVFLGIAPAPLFHALINPRYFEFERALDFSKEFLVNGLNKAIGVVVSVSVALTYQTYWAIILGMVAGVFAQMVLSYLIRPFRPRLSLAATRELLNFTGWMTGVSFMAAMNNKLDLLILGKLIGGTKAGIYYVADSIAVLPSQEIAEPIAKAIYPGLSELQERREAMRKAYLRGVEALALVAMPAAFGASFVAADLVRLLLGEGWDLAAPVIRWFAPVLGLMTLFSATQAYAMALGRTQLIFWREFIFFVIRMPIFIWAAAEFGFFGAVTATAVGGSFHALLNLVLYHRLSGRSSLEPLWRARRSFAGVAAMGGLFAVFAVTGAMGAWPFALRLFVSVALGASVYLGVVAALWRAEGEPDTVEAMVASRLRGEVA